MEIGSTFSNSNIDSTLAWESSQFIVSNFNEVFGKHKLKEHVWNNKACPKLQFRNCARKRNYFVKEKFNSLARNKIYFSLSKKETIPRTCSWLKIIFQTVEKLILENFLDKTRHSRREKYVFFPTRTNYPKIRTSIIKHQKKEKLLPRSKFHLDSSRSVLHYIPTYLQIFIVGQ